MGTAPVKVTRSACTSSQRSRGWGLGPAKIWVAPTMTPACGTHQALAWNMGTTCKMTSLSERAKVSAMVMAMMCRNRARCVYTTPLG